MLSETEKLLRLVLTHPITSNEGERSFSTLKRLLSANRSTMSEGRMDDLVRMSLHPDRLNKIETKRVIEIFARNHPRKLDFLYSNIDEGSIFFFFIFHIFIFTFSYMHPVMRIRIRLEPLIFGPLDHDPVLFSHPFFFFSPVTTDL